MDEHEEFEQVPWSQLTAATESSRPRLLQLGAVAAGAVVIGVAIGVMLGRDGSSAAPVSSTAALTPSPEEPTSTSAPAASPDGRLPELPGLYSEADLMAFSPVGAERAAATRAEWFVYDYFTADMEPSGSADVLGALPAGADLPDMPQDSASSLSYVEWARAFRIRQTAENEYLVAVVFRLLGAPPDRGFSRLSARAVEVPVLVTDDGGTAVTDLPSPVPLPSGPEPEPWPAPVEGEVPAGVVDEAVVVARAWGGEPRLVGGQPVDAGWRVVLTIADEVGNRWPVAIRVATSPGAG
jgi:hypothetical protein